MDGLIAMLGVVIGVAQATGSTNLVLVSGVVAGIANAFGISIGFYGSELAERGEHLLEGKEPSSMTEARRSSFLFLCNNYCCCRGLLVPFLLLREVFVVAMLVAVVEGSALLFTLGLVVRRAFGSSRIEVRTSLPEPRARWHGLILFVGDFVRRILQ